MRKKKVTPGVTVRLEIARFVHRLIMNQSWTRSEDIPIIKETLATLEKQIKELETKLN